MLPTAACMGSPSPACTPLSQGVHNQGGCSRGWSWAGGKGAVWATAGVLSSNPSTHAVAALPTWGSWRSRDKRKKILGTGPIWKEVREVMGNNSCGKTPQVVCSHLGDGGQH